MRIFPPTSKAQAPVCFFITTDSCLHCHVSVALLGTPRRSTLHCPGVKSPHHCRLGCPIQPDSPIYLFSPDGNGTRTLVHSGMLMVYWPVICHPQEVCEPVGPLALHQASSLLRLLSSSCFDIVSVVLKQAKYSSLCVSTFSVCAIVEYVRGAPDCAT